MSEVGFVKQKWILQLQNWVSETIHDPSEYVKRAGSIVSIKTSNMTPTFRTKVKNTTKILYFTDIVYHVSHYIDMILQVWNEDKFVQ